MSFTIRKGNATDLPYIYEICHLTGHNGSSAEGLIGDRNMLGHYFAGPYLVRDPDWTWIVVDDKEVPVGYLVATPESVPFFEWMESDWVPHLRARYPKERASGAGEFERIIRGIVHGKAEPPAMVADYPAHFHIDLLPVAQGAGLGSRLIDACKKQLVAQGIKGFYLGVGAGNAKVLPFYAKQGIVEHHREPGVIFLAWKNTAW